MLVLVVRDAYILLGGPQGGGLDTAMRVLSRFFASLGYSVLADREYYSNIRGKHSYVHMRVSVSKATSLTYPVDVAVAMDVESIFVHFRDVGKGGYFVYDLGTESSTIEDAKALEKYTASRIKSLLKELGLTEYVGDVVKWLRSEGVEVVGIKYSDLIEGLVKYGVPRNIASRALSTFAATATTYLLGLDPNEMISTIEDVFRGRASVIEVNKLMVKASANALRTKVPTVSKVLQKPETLEDELLVVTGNEIVAMGKLVGGIRFQSYYPITPAQDESFYMESKDVLKAGDKYLGSVLVFQTEDEIAAIASAVGAALAGARAATATSGPGFSLMVETLSWAGMNDVPVVITYYQRGGPSTGLPTRGAQSDLFFTMFAGHGEFPRVVIASGDHAEAFKDSIEALNIAEKYQVPVIHLLDKFIANTVVSMPVPKTEELRIERGKYYVGPGEGPFKRFSLDEEVPTRTFLGFSPITYYTGVEHDEYGRISEDPELRIRMYVRRMRKLEVIDREVPQEHRAVLYGDDEGDVLLIGWGFVKGVALDAIEELNSLGIKASYLHIKYFIPFPSKRVKDVIKRFRKYVFVEHDYLVQAGMAAKLFANIDVEYRIVKYTGRPIYTNELVDAVLKVVKEDVKEVVLRYGA